MSSSFNIFVLKIVCQDGFGGQIVITKAGNTSTRRANGGYIILAGLATKVGECLLFDFYNQLGQELATSIYLEITPACQTLIGVIDTSDQTKDGLLFTELFKPVAEDSIQEPVKNCSRSRNK